MQNGIGFTINFDPNRFDGYSVSELVGLTKLSLERTKFLLANLRVEKDENGKGIYRMSNTEEFDRLFNNDNVNLTAKEFEEIINNGKPYCKLPNVFGNKGDLKSFKEIRLEVAQGSEEEISRKIDNDILREKEIEAGKSCFFIAEEWKFELKIKDFTTSLKRLNECIQHGIEIREPVTASGRHYAYNLLASTALGVCMQLYMENLGFAIAMSVALCSTLVAIFNRYPPETKSFVKV